MNKLYKIRRQISFKRKTENQFQFSNSVIKYKKNREVNQRIFKYSSDYIDF